VTAGKELRRIFIGQIDSFSAAVSPGARLLAINGKTFQLWDVAAARLEKSLGDPPVRSQQGAIAFSPNGRIVAACRTSCGGLFRDLWVWEVATASLIRKFETSNIDGRALAFAPDGKGILVRSVSGDVLIASIDKPLHLGRLELVDPKRLDLEQLWSALAAPDGARAYHAIWALGAFPLQAAPYLREKLLTLTGNDSLTASRGIEALQYMNTTQAHDALTVVAAVATAPVCREEAQAALNLLDKQSKSLR